jgi:2-polyprenyl-6-hydroxyphenyl methylase/3-demethylubiquinone-9 3-methyltransferase
MEKRYEFGQNWASYAQAMPSDAIAQAVDNFQRLVPRAEVAGKTLLDLGCGSGLHSVAALRSGASRVWAVDIDPTSVQTTQRLLRDLADNEPWQAERRDAFDLSDLPRFDIVYSWGVLHHTGDLWGAVRAAAEKVAPGGLLVIAIYRKTPMCGFWKLEKRFYTAAPAWLRRLLEWGYMTAFRAGLRVRGRRLADYVRQYSDNRGMAWQADVRDWLGGYPYESASQDEVLATLEGLGFTCRRKFCRSPGIGVLGTGCDEYVFVKDRCEPAPGQP